MKEKEELYQEFEDTLRRIENTCDVGLPDKIYDDFLEDYRTLDKSYLERDFDRLREIIKELL